MRQPGLNKTHIITLAATVLGCVMGILGNLLAGWLQQYVLDRTFTLISIASILGLTAIGFFLGMWIEHRTIVISIKKVTYWMLVILVTGTVVLATALSWVYASLRPPTTYFLIDATEKMKPYFSDVRAQVSIATTPNAKIGLSIYGSSTNGSTGCGSTKQLVESNVYTNPKAKLDSALSNIVPSGHSSLIGAVSNTLKDLNKHDEPIKLVVITAGTDSECDLPNGSIPEGLIGDIKSNINIVIISIGELGPRESYLLESYTTALHGSYWNVRTASQLSQTIQAVPSYGSQNYDYLYPKFTPTPTP